MATKKDADPKLTNRQIHNARGLVATRLTKLLNREAKIALGEIEANATQVNALKNQIGRLMPQLSDVTYTTNDMNNSEVETEFNALMAKAKTKITDDKVVDIKSKKVG